MRWAFILLDYLGTQKKMCFFSHLPVPNWLSHIPCLDLRADGSNIDYSSKYVYSHHIVNLSIRTRLLQTVEWHEALERFKEKKPR